MVGFNLTNLFEDRGVRWIESSEPTKCLHRLFVLVLLDEEPGSLGEEQQSNAYDDGPGELDCDGDTVRARIVSGACGVVHDGCEKEAL